MEVKDSLMVEVGKFVGCLKSCSIDFFADMPDPLPKSFCAYVTDTCKIVVRESGAVGLVGGRQS